MTIKAITLDSVKIYNNVTASRVEVARMAKGVIFFASELVSNFLHTANGYVPLGPQSRYIDVLDWNYAETPPPPPPPVIGEVHTDVVIVRQRYYPEIPWTWKIDPITKERVPAKLEVNYTQLSDHDNPNDTLKGDRIEVKAAWFAHMRRIQDERAYNWVLTKHSWWFNKNDDWMSELITAAGSVHVVIGENATHWQIQGQPWDRETASLDPAVHNWWERPWEYTKVSAHNMTGQMFRVGSGFDGYAPLLQRKPKLWIAKVHAEKFKAVPFTVTYQERELVIVGYVLKGASVYGRTNTGETIPLLLARAAGERIFTTLQWSIWEQTTVPAKAHPV